MDILLVAQNYHPFVGGVETHARQVAQELAQDHRVRVAAMNFAPAQDSRPQDRSAIGRAVLEAAGALPASPAPS